MKTWLTLFLLFDATFRALAALPPEMGKLSAGARATCAIDAEGVKCWGSHEFNLQNVPPLHRPTWVSVGTSAACAVDIEGVKCWGGAFLPGFPDYYGELAVPPLKNPKMVSVSLHHYACAIDDEGVKCWGGKYGTTNGERIRERHEFKNPVFVATGEQPCALDDEGVKCWADPTRGFDSKPETPALIPFLANPLLVAAGSAIYCGINPEGAACWDVLSSWDFRQSEGTPKLLHPKMIAMAAYHACAVDERGVTCWGAKSTAGHPNPDSQSEWKPSRFDPPPPLKHPRFVSTGWDHSCAIDDDGIHCWGGNELGQTDVPPLVTALSEEAGLRQLLQTVGRVIYREHQPLYEAALAFVDSPSVADEAALGFIVGVLQADLSTIDSEVFVKTLRPRWEQALATLNKKLKVGSLLEIPRTAAVRQVSAIFLRRILQASRQTHGQAEELLADLGKLEAAGQATDSRQLAALLAKSVPLRNELLGDSRMSGYGQILQMLAVYFGG